MTSLSNPMHSVLNRLVAIAPSFKPSLVTTSIHLSHIQWNILLTLPKTSPLNFLNPQLGAPCQLGLAFLRLLNGFDHMILDPRSAEVECRSHEGIS